MTYCLQPPFLGHQKILVLGERANLGDVDRVLDPGPIFDLPMFNFHCIRFCQMHVLHLGVDLLVAGNILFAILHDYTLWGLADDASNMKLVRAYSAFKSWCKNFKWQHFAGI